VGLGGLIYLAQDEGPVTAFCDHGKGSFGSVKSKKFKKKELYLAFTISFTRKVCVCVCMYIFFNINFISQHVPLQKQYYMLGIAYI